MRDPPDHAGKLLTAPGGGDRGAFERLIAQVYPDLKRIAHIHLNRARPGDTLNTTVVVHEAYLRLAKGAGARWESREHFLAVAAQAMRQIIVDYVRARKADKRGGGVPALRLDDANIVVIDRDTALLDLDEALARLDTLDERLGRVVECRFFAGLTEQDTAEALGVPLRTVQRTWMRAKAWLRMELRDIRLERPP